MSLARYIEILDELLRQRKIHGSLDDDTEEAFAVALNDCRREMSPEDEAKIADIVARRIQAV